MDTPKMLRNTYAEKMFLKFEKIQFVSFMNGINNLLGCILDTEILYGIRSGNRKKHNNFNNTPLVHAALGGKFLLVTFWNPIS